MAMNRGKSDEADLTDKGAELAAEALAAMFRRGHGASRSKGQVGGENLGSLMYAWADLGVQVLRRMMTLSAEVGDAAFSRAWGAGSAAPDDVAVSRPIVEAVVADGQAKGQFEVVNRRGGYADFRFPAVAELHSADGTDRRLVELKYSNPSPLVASDAPAKVDVSFSISGLKERARYIGWVTIETTRGGRAQLAMQCEIPAKPSSEGAR